MKRYSHPKATWIPVVLNIKKNRSKYIISLNFYFLSSVYLAMYCYFKDKLVIAHLYFGRVFVQVFSPIQ